MCMSHVVVTSCNAPCVSKCFCHGARGGRQLVQYHAVTKVRILVLVIGNAPDYGLCCVDILRKYEDQTGSKMQQH